MPHNLISVHGSHVPLLKFQMVPRLKLLIYSGSKKKEPIYTCLSEAKASHSQRMWAKFSSCTPHLHKGRLFSPIKWRCLLSVLCPVRRSITTLDCALLKDKSLVFALGPGTEINSRACLWVLPRPCHLAHCWLSNQRFIFLIFCLEAPKDSSGPTSFWAEPSIASLSAISFPHTPACPKTQYSSTVCWVEISFNAFWHWQPGVLSEPPGCQSKYSCSFLVYYTIEFHKHRPR